MILGSDGLGKTELEGEIIKVRKVDDLVILFARTTKPVRWQTRMGFQEKDLRDLVLSFLRPRNVWFVLKALMLYPFNALFPSQKDPSSTEISEKKEAI